MEFLNPTSRTLVYGSITNPATGRTLRLEPGGTVDLDVDPEHPDLVRAGTPYSLPALDAVEGLTGPAVDEALRFLDLPTTGKVDVRRTRLAEALAAQVDEDGVGEVSASD